MHTIPSPEKVRGTPRTKISSPALSRTFLDNEFVYCVISQRGRGLSIGVNMNPDKRCNFDCVYCEIDRSNHHHGPARVKISAMIHELQQLLTLAHTHQLREHGFDRVPEDLLLLK